MRRIATYARFGPTMLAASLASAALAVPVAALGLWRLGRMLQNHPA